MFTLFQIHRALAILPCSESRFQSFSRRSHRQPKVWPPGPLGCGRNPHRYLLLRHKLALCQSLPLCHRPLLQRQHQQLPVEHGIVVAAEGEAQDTAHVTMTHVTSMVRWGTGPVNAKHGKLIHRSKEFPAHGSLLLVSTYTQNSEDSRSGACSIAVVSAASIGATVCLESVSRSRTMHCLL